MTHTPESPLGVNQQIPGRRVAVIEHGTRRRYTYEELRRHASAFASALVRLGAGRTDVVALLLDNGPKFAATYHGVLQSGRTVQALDPGAHSVEWRQALSQSRARWLVTTSARWRKFDERAHIPAPCNVILVDPAPEDYGVASSPRPVAWSEMTTQTSAPGIATNAHEGAVLIATSGTIDGRPKQVLHSYKNLEQNLRQIHELHELSARDVVMSVTPWRHHYGMQMVMNHALQCGATIVTVKPPIDSNVFLSAVREHRVTVAYLVPHLIARLADEPLLETSGLRDLRAVFSGAGLLDPARAARCSQRLGVPVLQGFGMTEAGCTHITPDGTFAPNGSVGVPLPGTDVRISDIVTGRELPHGEDGHLWVRGPQISAGALREMAREFSEPDPFDGWFPTGDIGRVDDRGHLSITGRLKDIMKYHGFAILPSESEHLLHAHPQVRDAAVVGIPDVKHGDIPKAFVVLNGEVDEKDVLSDVNEKLPPQRRLRLIETIDRIPRNAMGKVLRRQLLEPDPHSADHRGSLSTSPEQTPHPA